MKVPSELDLIAKTALAYRPPEKAKATAKREKVRLDCGSGEDYRDGCCNAVIERDSLEVIGYGILSTNDQRGRICKGVRGASWFYQKDAFKTSRVQ